MRISDWSSDVCSSDLLLEEGRLAGVRPNLHLGVGVSGQLGGVALFLALVEGIGFFSRLNMGIDQPVEQIGSASCRERVCQTVEISVLDVSLKKKATQHKTLET